MIENKFYLWGKKLKEPLSDEEQLHYLELVKSGDAEAKEILFEHNLGLVGLVTRKYLNTGIDKEDLFQIGSEGLLKAINNFDLSYGNSFSTYAVPVIIGEIRRYISDKKTLIRIPRSIRALSHQILKLKDENGDNIESLSTQEIAKKLDVDEADVILALNSIQDVSSLQETVLNDSKKEITLEDVIPDTKFSFDNIIEKMDLQSAIGKLNKIEQVVIKSLYGIDTEPKVQMVIAKELGISQAQVSRISTSAINKIKKELIKNGIEGEKMETKVQKLLENYPGYTEEQILDVINKLEETDRKIMELRFGLNGHEPMKNKDVAEELAISQSRISSKVGNIKMEIGRKLREMKYIRVEETSKKEDIEVLNFEEKNNTKTNPTNKLFEYFKGYTEEQILNAVNELKEKGKRIIELKYGLNGNEPLKNKEIAQQLGIKETSVAPTITNVKKVIEKKLVKNSIKKEEVEILNFEENKVIEDNKELGVHWKD